MKHLIPIALSFITAVSLTAGSSSVFAQDQSATVTTTTSTSSTDPAMSAKKFDERKATVLQHISDRITKMQQIQSCVQAANDLKTMRACRPKKDKEHHKHSGG